MQLYASSLDVKQRKGSKGQLGAEDAVFFKPYTLNLASMTPKYADF